MRSLSPRDFLEGEMVAAKLGSDASALRKQLVVCWFVKAAAVNMFFAAQKSLAYLLMLTGSLLSDADGLPDWTDKRFPMEELLKLAKPGSGNKDGSDTEDDDEDDEDAEGPDDDDDDAGDEDFKGGDEGGDDDDEGDPEEDPEANGNGGSGDDDDDDGDDDEDGEEDEDDDEDEDDEDDDEEDQPPAKKRK